MIGFCRVLYDAILQYTQQNGVQAYVQFFKLVSSKEFTDRVVSQIPFFMNKTAEQTVAYLASLPESGSPNSPYQSILIC